MIVGSCRAHFRLKGIEAGDQTSSIREFRINLGDGATGISMHNAQCIMHNYWYDLQGRKLSGKPTVPGIYIHNGKKIIIY